MEIKFDHDILQAAPSLEVILVEASIINPPTSNELWKEITDMEEQIHDNLPIEQIRHRPAIDATRKAYKACGKDPNRYRPSAEALCRRAAKNLELYRTLTAIDLINLLSMATGHSIGGFDADKIDGNTLTLGVGSANEPYEEIGRGPLNIEGLPVYRDRTGGIGTPTSDNERTKLSPETRHLLMTINMYGADPDYPADKVAAMTERLLTQYAGASHINTRLIKAYENT